MSIQNAINRHKSQSWLLIWIIVPGTQKNAYPNYDDGAEEADM